MMKSFLEIKYYVAAAALVLVMYAWTLYTGAYFFGDDNMSKGVVQGAGSGHVGGHGFYYFHK